MLEMLWPGCNIYFSRSSCNSSNANSERALKSAGLGRGLAFSWREVGGGRLRTYYDCQKFPWRQWTLQAWDVEPLASKCQIPYMENSRWCPLSDWRACHCLGDTRKVLWQPTYSDTWYVSMLCYGPPNFDLILLMFVVSLVWRYRQFPVDQALLTVILQLGSIYPLQQDKF